MYEIFASLLKEKGVRASDVSKATGLSSTFFTEWKKGKSKNPNPANLKKIADYFNVTVDYLMTGEESKESETNLSPRAVKDIEEIISGTAELLTQDGLMFDGKPADKESIDSILSAMKIGMEMAKQRNKEKYTPKKYKKDW